MENETEELDPTGTGANNKTSTVGPENPLTESSLNKAVSELQKTITKFGTPIWIVLTVIVLALLLAFITMLLSTYTLYIESNHDKSAKTQELSTQLNILIQQNERKEKDQKSTAIVELEQQIKDLKLKNPYLK